MFVRVFKLGEEENILTVFPRGTHIIGRGPALQCNDKRVSRNHATIEVTENEVKITSNHINPCFLKVANSKTVTILPKDSSSSLNDGDMFALLPDTYWFKVKIIAGETQEETIIEQVTKRHLDDLEQTLPEKRRKVEESDSKDKVEELPLESNVPIDTTIKMEQGENNNKEDSSNEIVQNDALLDTTDHSVKEEQQENNDIAEDGINGLVVDSDQKVEELNTRENSDELDDGTGPSTSDTKVKPRRERCWYGAQCYRKNPIHRQDFTHPGDSDFESDPDDNRPTCSFGATCYRKNMDHRRNYKHPAKEPPNKLKKKRTRKKVDRLNMTDYDDEDDLSDEDPFIADDDSDEYVAESDDDDTDWEDSQNVDEDSENMNRLVREAKRFTK